MIYARVSTDEQASKGTIEHQIDACRDYCEKAGFDVVQEFKDDGVSGTIHLSERPAGAQLIAWADAQNFDVVVLTSSDRIGRHTLVIELAKDYLKKRVKIEYVYETYEDSPEGELHEGVSGLFSQYEHSKIKLRLQGGLRKKVREHGGYVASQRPYGYVKTADGNLTEHPEEGPIVK